MGFETGNNYIDTSIENDININIRKELNLLSNELSINDSSNLESFKGDELGYLGKLVEYIKNNKNIDANTDIVLFIQNILEGNKGKIPNTNTFKETIKEVLLGNLKLNINYNKVNYPDGSTEDEIKEFEGPSNNMIVAIIGQQLFKNDSKYVKDLSESL